MVSRHGAQVEGGELVAFSVRRREALRREGVGVPCNAARRDAERFKRGEVFAAILPYGGNEKRFFTEKRERVGDVARAAAAAAPHGVRLEGEVDVVELLSKKMIRKASGEVEDGVVGDGAAHKDHDGRLEWK